MYTYLCFTERRKVLWGANLRKSKSADTKAGRQRRRVLKRCGNRCTYCGRPLNLRNATRDHIVPKIQGGSNRQENLTAACETCNVAKDGRTPLEWLADLQAACERLGLMPQPTEAAVC
jgi:5-methylcytosine-specific restriction endonuclease McrA